MGKIYSLPKFLAFALIGFFISTSVNGQDRFINMTEIGPSFGRLQSWWEHYETRINVSIQTFNGVLLKEKHAVGFSLGLDTYPSFTIVPMAFGYRYFREKGKRHTWFGAMDLGYGSSMLTKPESDDWQDFKYYGGLLTSAAVGVKRNSKKKSHAYSLSVGFRRQEASFFRGTREFGTPATLPGRLERRNYTATTTEEYVMKNLMVRFGLIF